VEPLDTGVPNFPTGAIEQHYYVDGPWAVTQALAFACCDSSGDAYDAWYPTDLGANGFRHPIITWGDGTNSLPVQGAYLFKHLASWGFVIVAAENKATGSGAQIVDAARYMAAQDTTVGSLFYGKLDTDHIGVLGHSQGADGAINALIKAEGFIRTAVVLEKPTQVACTLQNDCPTSASIPAGLSVFYVNGSADIVISPSTQFGSPCILPGGVSNENSNECYYQDTPDDVEKLWATLIGANHDDVGGAPTCAGVFPPCNNGVYGYLGYPTAWMMDRLQNDRYAHGAFVSGSGEIFHETANWENAESNIQ
jgi:hypothetical protein